VLYGHHNFIVSIASLALSLSPRLDLPESRAPWNEAIVRPPLGVGHPTLGQLGVGPVTGNTSTRLSSRIRVIGAPRGRDRCCSSAHKGICEGSIGVPSAQHARPVKAPLDPPWRHVWLGKASRAPQALGNGIFSNRAFEL